MAKEKLIIVDSYADKVVLDIIRRLSVKVIIITKPNDLLTKQDIEKYNKEYHNLKVIFDKSFHDRFFVIDNSTVFYCGASINEFGYKTFFIGKVEDFETSKFFISRVDSIMNMVR